MNARATAAAVVATLCVLAVLVVVDRTPVTVIREDPAAHSVIHAIVDLKAYARTALPGLDAKFKDEHKSGAVYLVEKLGKAHAADVDVVTEFAQAMGDLLTEHNHGMNAYVLHNIYDKVLEGQTVVVQGTGGYAAKMMFDGMALGLRDQPQYLLDMSVRTSDYTSTRVDLHEGSGGKAIEAWEKSSKLNAYHEYYNKLKAQYMQQQQAEDLLQEEGAKVALHASFKAGMEAGREGHEVLHPLPTAGAAGGQAVRSKRKWHFPSEEEIVKKAKAMAKKFMKEIAGEGLTVDSVIKKIESEMEGTTIKISTSSEMFADSNESPTIKIVGSKGAIESKIDALPLLGEETTQTFSHNSIGLVQEVTISSDSTVTNPWMCTGFKVQVGHGKPWIDVMPDKTEALWLDGRSSEHQTGPYYGAPHKDSWVLTPKGAEDTK